MWLENSCHLDNKASDSGKEPDTSAAWISITSSASKMRGGLAIVSASGLPFAAAAANSVKAFCKRGCKPAETVLSDRSSGTPASSISERL